MQLCWLKSKEQLRQISTPLLHYTRAPDTIEIETLYEPRSMYKNLERNFSGGIAESWFILGDNEVSTLVDFSFVGETCSSMEVVTSHLKMRWKQLEDWKKAHAVIQLVKIATRMRMYSPFHLGLFERDSLKP